MKGILAIVASLLLASATLAQKAGGAHIASDPQRKLRQAERLAERFVRRFVQTLDYRLVYREMFIRDRKLLRYQWENDQDSFLEANLKARLDFPTFEAITTIFAENFWLAWMYVPTDDDAAKNFLKILEREVKPKLNRRQSVLCKRIMEDFYLSEKDPTRTYEDEQHLIKTRTDVLDYIAVSKFISASYRRRILRTSRAGKVKVITSASNTSFIDEEEIPTVPGKKVTVYYVTRGWQNMLGFMGFEIIEEAGKLRIKSVFLRDQ
jgi:hypothetical protein